MRNILRLIVPLLPFFLMPWAAPGQERSTVQWDELLDRYERICRMCIELKSDGASGDSFSEDTLLPLLQELSELRDEIKGAEDRMPVPARRRYEAIRRMYASGEVTDTHPGPLLPGLRHLRARPPAFTKAAAIQRRTMQGRRPEPMYRWSVEGTAVVVPEQSFGASASCLGRKMGAYAAFRSSFTNHNPSYSALSDGTYGSTFVWTTGAAASDRLFVTAGPMVRIGKRMSVFGGLGYGMRRLCWEDSEGKWFEVTDASRRGLCAEAGLGLHLGRFKLSAGWISLPFSYNGMTFSVGYSFGRFY